MVKSYKSAKQIKFFFALAALIGFAGLEHMELFGKAFSRVKEPTKIQSNQADKGHGCPPSERKNYPEKTLHELINMLRSSKLSFTGPYVYNVERDDILFDAISDYGHAAVEQLVDCLDSTEPTAVMWRGRPVWLGVVCWVALRHVAYYEPDSKESWGGTLGEMPEEISELQKVKKAWQSVLKKRAYVLH